MKLKLLAAFVAAGALAAVSGCSSLQNLSSTNVPVKSILVAANGADSALILATTYLNYCAPKVQPVGCSNAAAQAIIPAVKSVRDARNAAEQFVADNPDAKLGPATLISAISSANAALQAIETEYNIQGVAK